MPLAMNIYAIAVCLLKYVNQNTKGFSITVLGDSLNWEGGGG